MASRADVGSETGGWVLLGRSLGKGPSMTAVLVAPFASDTIIDANLVDYLIVFVYFVR